MIRGMIYLTDIEIMFRSVKSIQFNMIFKCCFSLKTFLVYRVPHLNVLKWDRPLGSLLILTRSIQLFALFCSLSIFLSSSYMLFQHLSQFTSGTAELSAVTMLTLNYKTGRVNSTWPVARLCYDVHKREEIMFVIVH